MNNSNKIKSSLLGENASTANGKLRKLIIFELVKETGRNLCYRCSLPIVDLTELSIEHKVAWQSSDKPSEYFYSWDNISFSHLVCNVAAAVRKNHNSYKTHCAKGHKLSDNAYITPSKPTSRRCSLCVKAGWKKDKRQNHAKKSS